MRRQKALLYEVSPITSRSKEGDTLGIITTFQIISFIKIAVQHVLYQSFADERKKRNH